MNRADRRETNRDHQRMDRLHYRHHNDWWTDFFCGAGGASTGLVRAGFEVALAANHWDVAIATHGANHPETEHITADINNYDMRRLPTTRYLWASVICTEESPAGGKKKARRPHHAQGDLLEEEGKVDSDAFTRTRATAYDVIRATEVHRYDVVIVENVVEFYEHWELFDWWTAGFAHMNYQIKVFSINSAHVSSPDNEAAPQWRDRIYVAIVREGLPMPDLTPRPVALCTTCDQDVEAVQSWRNGHTVGKYRQQYDYRCPREACSHAVVEPYIRPAAEAIDWTNLGARIGDRPRPLVASTREKIRRGLAEYSELLEPLLVTATHGGTDGRVLPARLAPLPTRTAKIGDGFVVPPGAWPEGGFVAELRGGGSTFRPLAHPFGTLSTSRNHGLVIPYRKGSARPTSDPLLTLATRDSAGLVLVPQFEVDDCWYRMLQPREQLLAQRFPGAYIVHGTKGEQTMQAGNAVSCNVAQFVGERVQQAMYGLAA